MFPSSLQAMAGLYQFLSCRFSSSLNTKECLLTDPGMLPYLTYILGEEGPLVYQAKLREYKIKLKLPVSFSFLGPAIFI